MKLDESRSSSAELLPMFPSLNESARRCARSLRSANDERGKGPRICSAGRGEISTVVGVADGLGLDEQARANPTRPESQILI